MEDYSLKSTHLGFSCWTEADTEKIWELFGDAEITRFVGGPFSPAEVRARLLREICSERAHGVQYWPIFLLSTAEYIGCCGLKVRSEPDSYEIGFYLKKPFHGKGYAAEAAREIIRYAFDKLKAESLFAGHHPHNEASRGLLGKLGFAYVRDEYYPPTGLMHPLYRFTDGKTTLPELTNKT